MKHIFRTFCEKVIYKLVVTACHLVKCYDFFTHLLRKTFQNAKELEREKTKIFNEKLMLDDELDRRRREISQCKKVAEINNYVRTYTIQPLEILL